MSKFSLYCGSTIPGVKEVAVPSKWNARQMGLEQVLELIPCGFGGSQGAGEDRRSKFKNLQPHHFIRLESIIRNKD